MALGILVGFIIGLLVGFSLALRMSIWHDFKFWLVFIEAFSKGGN